MRSFKLAIFFISLIGLLELLVLLLAYFQGTFEPSLFELLLVGGFPLINAAGIFFLSQGFSRDPGNKEIPALQVRICFWLFSLLHLIFSSAMALWFIWRIAFPAAVLLPLIKLLLIFVADRKILKRE